VNNQGCLDKEYIHTYHSRFVPVGVAEVWCPGQNKRLVTPEIDCDQSAMGLPPVTSAVFLLVILVKRGYLGGISEMSLRAFWG
jgi:hypothetical protein